MGRMLVLIEAVWKCLRSASEREEGGEGKEGGNDCLFLLSYFIL